MIVQRYEEALEKYGYFAGPPVGTSMLPLIRQAEDVVEIRPCKTVRVLDVILYRRANGDTVLHRVVGKRKSGYVLRGDNQIVNEYGVKDVQILPKGESARYAERSAAAVWICMVGDLPASLCGAQGTCDPWKASPEAEIGELRRQYV